MSQEQATAFIDKFMESDDFLAEVIKKSDLNNHPKASEKEQAELFTKAGNELGYSFTADEYSAELSKVAERYGIRASFKFISRLSKISKKVKKGQM